jgi:hypothetical protein
MELFDQQDPYQTQISWEDTVQILRDSKNNNQLAEKMLS